jgi:hypothetical protein
MLCMLFCLVSADCKLLCKVCSSACCNCNMSPHWQLPLQKDGVDTAGILKEQRGFTSESALYTTYIHSRESDNSCSAANLGLACVAHESHLQQQCAQATEVVLTS